jgi:hypothetical protein
LIKLGDKSVLNCPKCDKEYNMEEYEKLDKAETQTYEQPIISVRGKAAQGSTYGDSKTDRH